MLIQQPPHKRSIRAGLNRPFSLLSAVALFASALLLPAPAVAHDPEAASALCKQFSSSVRNLREHSTRRDVLEAVRLCIDLGVDAPLKARRDYGRLPASGVPRAQIPSKTCPPFATCLYSARVNRSQQYALNHGDGATRPAVANLPVSSSYAAPQFSGHLPSEVPEHLKHGGTVYFYGTDVWLTPPADSLLYPDIGTNFYADGSDERITNGHVMTPPAPEAKIFSQQPIRVNQQAKINFDDGGIVLLPTGFTGELDGVQLQPDDIVVINHAGDFMVPAGTRLYPFPMGIHPEGAHVDTPNYAPYDGPPIQLPSNIAVTVEEEDVPGLTIWWQAP